jgi:uncharacterized protein YjdB
VPNDGQFYLGQYVTITADQYGKDGKIVPGSQDFLGGIPVSWASSDSAIALPQGYRNFATVDGLATGSVIISATSDGKQATVRLHVIQEIPGN